MLTYRNKQDRVSALTERFVQGDLSEPVYTASLLKYCGKDEIRELVMNNRAAHRTSRPYLRGDVA